ncbi:MAG: HAMP domain-containing histidine kinase [Oscillospiraceae bacterium]|jgi:signal transduction histidine kinase|nr:HAMP domain-containing histidine kinase [Oscillospiraceae bacterium]MCI9549742.1 HAMP domain-containing histidine kinase [Oscillospiraceae bacterium]
MLPWPLCAALAVLVLSLILRLRLLQNSLDEIGRQLEERLGSDTNNPIFLSTRDPHARKLAVRLNLQLKELRRLRRRYENGDRELKEAVTNVSHDLRTPLTAICGYLELLDRGDKTPDQARYLALISGRTQAMRRLTDQLLRYSVAAGMEDELKLEPVDLNGAVEEAVAAFYGALVEQGVTPAVSLPEARVVRQLDRAALARVLGNLLANALKYSGGDLDIVLDGEGTIVLSNAAPGLDEVQVGRLFDRFYTVETGRASTGLGLSIAKALTERLGGAISARYEAGRLAVELCFPDPGSSPAL